MSGVLVGDDVTVSELIRGLLERMQLPSNDTTGRPIAYHARLDRIGAHGVQRIGRVPLGTHRRGNLRLSWNLRVHGKRLHAGRYRITLRALDRKGNVLGTTRPVTLRLRG